MDKLSLKFPLISIVGVFLFLLCWDESARLFATPKLFPWPRYIWQHSVPLFAPELPFTFWRGILSLLNQSLSTAIRVVISTCLGIGLGVCLGLLLFFPLKQLVIVSSILKMLRGIPLLSLIPLFVLWFGDSEFLAVYGYITYAVAVIVVSDTYSTACRLPAGLLSTAKLAGAGRFKTLTLLVMPAVTHNLAGSINTVIGLAWAFAVGAELIVLNKGLGHLLHISYMQTDVGRMIVLAIIYALLGWSSVRIANIVLSYCYKGEQTNET